jgi:hypothetical protein
VKPLILTLAAALLVFLPEGLAARTATLREQSQRTVEVGDLAGLRVENPRGLVEVRPSSDGRIHVTALKLASASERSRARQFSRRTTVETSTAGDRFVVRVRYPQHQSIRVNLWRLIRGDFDFPGVEVRLAIEVPPSFQVELGTASGDLETYDLSGKQSLRTASGDISVRAAEGPVRLSSTSGNVMGSWLAGAHVRTVSGDVTLDNVRGPLEVHSTSGDIEVRKAGNDLTFSTVSGDIWVDRAPRGIEAISTSGDVVVDDVAAGAVRLRSTAGNVRVGLDRGLRRADVNTVSGDIRLRLADALGCDLTITSKGGTIDSSVPLEIRTVSRHEMSGMVRGGGPPVVLHSASGDIAVTGGGR